MLGCLVSGSLARERKASNPVTGCDEIQDKEAKEAVEVPWIMSCMESSRGVERELRTERTEYQAN